MPNGLSPDRLRDLPRFGAKAGSLERLVALGVCQPAVGNALQNDEVRVILAS